MHNMVAWDDCNGCAYLLSLCLRGEWIEIDGWSYELNYRTVSLLARRVD